jgi:hypothetical protein
MMNSGETRKEGEMDLQEIIIRIGPIGPEQEQALATTPAGRELLDLYLEVAARASGCRRTTRRWGMFVWDDGDPGEGVLVIEGPVLGAPEPLNAVKRAAVMAGCWLTSLPRLKSWDSRPLILRPVGFALHRVPYVGISLHAL